MPSLLVLLLLLGTFSPASARSFLSVQLMDDVDTLAPVLKLTQPAVVTQPPLFSKVYRVLNASCPSSGTERLVNATLDVYARVFSSALQRRSALLQQAPKEQLVEQKLRKLQGYMEGLRSSMTQPGHQRALDYLATIKVDDVDVQRRALAEFKSVYQAVALVSHRCSHAHSSSSSR